MDTADRFSNRVEYYIKYRPGYPEQVIDLLKSKYDLGSTDEIADIGAGVGHSAKLFTDYGCYVYGIEPNADMHNALIDRMKRVANFSARLKTASNTDLESNSIDFIVCAQSFHWFNVKAAKTEFLRILKDNGTVVLMWNSWQEDTDFGQDYTTLLKNHSTDYENVSRTNPDMTEKIDYLFDTYEKDVVEHSQYFDLEALKGRYLSSSYALLPDMDGHEAAMTAIEELFDKYASDGTIEFRYDCEIYHGSL